MKTNFTLAAVFLFFALISNAQLRIAIIGGPNSSSVIEKNNLAGWDSMVKPNYTRRSGINLGIIADIPVGNSGSWFFHPGMIYQGKGRKFSVVNDSTTAQVTDTASLKRSFLVNYIEFPLNAAYKHPIGRKGNLIISAGPYLGFFLSGKQTFETRFYSTNGFKKEEENIEVGKSENKANTVDFGVNARAGFEFGNVVFTGFFSTGLTNFYSASYQGTFKNRVVGFSFGIWLRGSNPAESKPKDSDKDGIPDTEDACPTLPGTLLTLGCPDLDSDGIVDEIDNCPDRPGVQKYRGCPIPDTDVDGINDEEDKCPEQQGSLKYNGCPVPDRDNDGMNDESDACPDTAGIVEFNGCPVPDSDGDGINDKEDKCPTVTGDKENNGCPPVEKETVEKVNFAARNIFFHVGSGKISSRSFIPLNEIVEIMEKNPSYKLEINGHTDNSGNPTFNLALSLERADAVKIYLVRKGILQVRLITRGYGQEQPLTDNNTPEGKLQNRRVELRLLTN